MSAETGTASVSQPSLRRSLGLWDLIIIGIVIIQPIAPMGIYGAINNEAGGHVVTTILIAMVAMLFTAVSYGKMARAYPSAGSAYTYVGREIHPALGYVTGWAMVMDYILNPLVCTVICSELARNVLPQVPYAAFAVAFAALLTALNLRAIHTSAKINEVLAAGMTIVVVIFFAFVARSGACTNTALDSSPSLSTIRVRSASTASFAAPRLPCSPTSASTASPPFPRKPKTRAAIFFSPPCSSA